MNDAPESGQIRVSAESCDRMWPGLFHPACEVWADSGPGHFGYQGIVPLIFLVGPVSTSALFLSHVADFYVSRRLCHIVLTVFCQTTL